MVKLTEKLRSLHPTLHQTPERGNAGSLTVLVEGVVLTAWRRRRRVSVVIVRRILLVVILLRT